MNLLEIAPGLTRHETGYWVAPEVVEPSYPADGSNLCLAVEEESFWFAHRNRAITAAVTRHPPANGPIFDVGGGNGVVTAALLEAGFPAITIEPSRAGATNAIRRGIHDVVCGSLPSSAFRENTAGAIGLFDVIEHVPDDVGFLRALRPYVKPNGHLYITVPAYPWLWSENDVRSGHYRRYTVRSLVEAVKSSGFEPEYSTYFFAALPPAILLFRRLMGNDGRSRTRVQGQHRAGGTLGRRMADALFSFEIARIARGASVLFGASCLMAATPGNGEREQ